MQLNKQTDYAVRVLVYLGSAADSERCTVSEMSETLGVSANNLAKIVNRFANQGLITTVRGRNGGIQIKRETLDYPLGELVSMFEPDCELADCDHANCNLVEQCGWRDVLAGSREAMIAHMNRYRVRDLLKDRAWLNRVLRPGQSSASPS
ncbi:HTH-type transcriptional repressor NsrR [Marinobacterium nitratireducens]|uniref:HTH-type transcriptional repressor NsrR n=1 Tax=Marinobacterium nitratireducens TaxID=518897 RepID=A0A918DRJ3_9GAMM|nr:Rrf2 family transcriptional regulator [Marinobacterium nitratireducens]GGO81192.1 HTH-type transcriptional repressor NsrR [Marinobacterium nitratireducens]